MKYDRSTIYRAFQHAHQTQDWNQSEYLRQTRFYVEELEQRIMLDGAVASALVEHIPVTEKSLSAQVLDAHPQEEFRFVNGRWVLPAETEAMVRQDREFWNARAAEGGGDATGPELAPTADTFFLHSNPTATKTIYLDFDGNTTIGTSWNSPSKPTIVSPAYDPDGNGAAFTDNELNRIQRIWYRVAEDYSPFNVNVTTEDPGEAALVNTGGTDTEWGIRVVVTGDDFANCNCGGFAYLDSFNWGYESTGATDTPVFVFNTSELGVWAAATHEVGHAVGLSHDGTTNSNPIQPNSAYYNGHGSGETSWGPIMGSGYYANVTTWDRGEYTGANNGQDDIAIITTRNGFGFRADDHGDVLGSASSVNYVGVNATDPNLVDVALFGIIEDRADLDFIKFDTGAGTVNFTINSYVNQVWTSNGGGTYSNSIEGTFFDGVNWPNNQGSNLDVEAKLYDSNGTQIASSNPTGLSAGFSNLNLNAGTYYIRVDGVGFGSPSASSPTGYTDYASIGQYYVSGTVHPTGDGDENGPRVISPSPAGFATAPGVTSVLVTFNEAIADGTFTAGDVSLTDPNNDSISVSVSEVANSNRREFEINFAALSAPGAYHLTIGPHVLDLAGNMMNQDGDTTNGETIEDQFTTALTINEVLVFTSANVPLPVRDYVLTASYLTIPDNIVIADIDLVVDISHGNVGDLEIDLISPAGAGPILSYRTGGSGDNYSNTRFDDEASTPITSGSAPFNGSFQPQNPLSTFDGQDAKGQWALYVIDWARRGQGTLNSWTLYITPEGPPPPANNPPVAAHDGPYVAEEDKLLTVAATAGLLTNDMDSDGPNNVLTASLVNGPSDGSLTLNPDGSFTYTPDADFNGNDSFTYRAYDGQDYSSPATVSITVKPVADAPVANADSATTTKNNSVIIDVAANDSDVDGNLNVLSAAVATAPTNGNVIKNGDGTLTYTPNTDFTGNDSFTYIISDTNGLTATAMVNITVQNDIIVITSGVVNVPIRDYQQTESRITINDNFIIGDVDVVVKINHKYDGQLDINLVPPWGWNGGYSGTHPYTGGSLIGPVLSWQNGGSGDNYADTRFDDEASLSINDGSAPFSGSYRPEVLLSTLTVSEHSVQGSWTLLVYDRGNRYSGTLVSWELHITPASGSSSAAIESEARTVESESNTVESGQSAALRSTVSLPANVAESTSLLFAPPSQALQPEQAITTPESPATSTNGRHQNVASLQVLHVPVPGGKLNPLLQKEGLRRVDAEVLDSIGIQFF